MQELAHRLTYGEFLEWIAHDELSASDREWAQKKAEVEAAARG